MMVVKGEEDGHDEDNAHKKARGWLFLGNKKKKK